VHNGRRRTPRSPDLPLHGHWPGRVNVVLDLLPSQERRAGSPRLEAPLGALGAKSKRIDGGEVLLGGHCTYYHQYDALRETIYTTVLFVQL
jgi:hypothetical protein